jgi:hypothetical protein
MAFQFTTPAGRIVSGDPYTFRAQTDRTTKQPKLNKDGTPLRQQYLALALRKDDPEVQAWKAKADAEARSAWPQWHNGPNGSCTNPTFSSKIIDGDGANSKGVSYKSLEGYAGCWVVKFTRQEVVGPVPVVAHDGRAWMQTGPTVPGSRVVKCGDYVKVQGDTKSNAPSQTDGMYMNMAQVAFWQEGQAIINAPSADEAFGTAPPPGSGTPAQDGQVMGTPPASSGYSGYVDTAAGDDTPPPPGGSAVPDPVMTAKAGGKTREQFHAKGWTDAQLVEHGMMVA